ncbi:MAG: hypothetical protein GWN86_07050 [Desulfobacterales bacterium]|nr:hypothetical protein [Desulfobacterales bacterium]
MIDLNLATTLEIMRERDYNQEVLNSIFRRFYKGEIDVAQCTQLAEQYQARYLECCVRLFKDTQFAMKIAKQLEDIDNAKEIY